MPEIGRVRGDQGNGIAAIAPPNHGPIIGVSGLTLDAAP